MLCNELIQDVHIFDGGSKNAVTEADGLIDSNCLRKFVKVPENQFWIQFIPR